MYLAVGVVTGKALALLVGPPGVGVYGLMQSFVGVAGIGAGLGIATSLVRLLAPAAGIQDLARAARLRVAAILAAGCAAILLFAVTFALQRWIASNFLGDPSLGGLVPLLGLAVGFTLIGAVEGGTLTGWHRVTALTRAVISASAVGGFATVALVATYGVRGIAPGLLTVGFTNAVATGWVAMREVGPPVFRVWRQSFPEAKALVVSGMPVALSQAVGTGAQLVVPIVILFELNQTAVGFYRAAATISVGYLAFVMNALAQDYFPRVAAAPHSDVKVLIERRTRLVVALGMPVILATLAIAPLVLALLYSSDFEPATKILQWQLIGDVLRLPAWAMAYAILARGLTLTYFTVELAGGASLVASVAVATQFLGLEGAGVGYLASSTIYYFVVWFGARRIAPVGPGRLQAVVVLAACGLIVLEVGLGSLPGMRSFLLISGAGLLALVAWPRLWQMHRTGDL